MGEIVELRRRRSAAESIRLFTGTMTSGPEAGSRTYLLEYATDEGAVIVWDGPTYEAALAAARDWQADGVRLVDDTQERP